MVKLFHTYEKFENLDNDAKGHWDAMKNPMNILLGHHKFLRTIKILNKTIGKKAKISILREIAQQKIKESLAEMSIIAELAKVVAEIKERKVLGT